MSTPPWGPSTGKQEDSRCQWTDLKLTNIEILQRQSGTSVIRSTQNPVCLRAARRDNGLLALAPWAKPELPITLLSHALTHRAAGHDSTAWCMINTVSLWSSASTELLFWMLGSVCFHQSLPAIRGGAVLVMVEARSPPAPSPSHYKSRVRNGTHPMMWWDRYYITPSQVLRVYSQRFHSTEQIVPHLMRSKGAFFFPSWQKLIEFIDRLRTRHISPSFRREERRRMKKKKKIPSISWGCTATRLWNPDHRLRSDSNEMSGRDSANTVITR